MKQRASVCFFGGARYHRPLDATNEKKFRLLSVLGEFFVIGFSPDAHPRWFTQHAHFYLLPQLPASLLRYAVLFLIGPLLALWAIFRRGVRILVAQSPYEGYAAAWTKKIAAICGHNVALVVEGHGDFEQSPFLYHRPVLPRLYGSIARRVARFTLRHADVLRAVSASTREQLERVAPGKPIRQFPAWTDIDVFRQEGAMEVTNPWDDIVFAGMLIRLKGVHHLVNSFLRLAPEFPQARLILAGRTEDEVLTAELHARVLQAGATERVQFVGDVPQAQLAALMRQARIFVLPSYTEGLGRVVLEAMMAGTPVLASAVGGILELVQDGETGVLTPPGDEAALEERLRWLLRHPREARALGQRARDVAVRYFSSASYVQGYRDTFALAQELLDKDEVCYASAAL